MSKVDAGCSTDDVETTGPSSGSPNQKSFNYKREAKKKARRKKRGEKRAQKTQLEDVLPPKNNYKALNRRRLFQKKNQKEQAKEHQTDGNQSTSQTEDEAPIETLQEQANEQQIDGNQSTSQTEDEASIDALQNEQQLERQLPAAARLRLRNARDKGQVINRADETIQEIIDKRNARKNEALETHRKLLKRERQANQHLCYLMANSTQQLYDLKSHHHRCKHHKMESTCVTQRSLQMVANTLFPDFFYPNKDLEEYDITFLKPNQVQIKNFTLHKGKRSHVSVGVYQTRDVAMKEYNQDKGRAVHEYRVLKANEKVPGLPRPHGIVYRGDVGMQLVMEYVCSDDRGIPWTLGDIIFSAYKIDPKEWLYIFYNVAIALDGLHENGFIHNSITPRNILIFQRNSYPSLVPKLTGFGGSSMVKYSTSPCEAVRLQAKQNEFLAPEIESGEAPEAPSDVYALGRTIRHCTQHCKIYDGKKSKYGVPQKLYDIGHECSEDTIDRRPVMSVVKEKIKCLL